MYWAIGLPFVAEGVCQAAVPDAAPFPFLPATGVLLGSATEVLLVTRDETPVALDCHSAQLFEAEAELDGSTGVADEEQEVEVLVQIGTEIVHGQSVTVRVVLSVTVYVLPAWTISVAVGTYVVMAVTMVVVQLWGASVSDVQSSHL